MAVIGPNGDLSVIVMRSGCKSVVCDTLFSTKETAHMYAECLVELAVDLGFDGWLVNNFFISVCLLALYSCLLLHLNFILYN